jgi:hypothetical protein
MLTGSLVAAFVRRPGVGIRGRPLKVRANHYPVSFANGQAPVIYQHDVDIVKGERNEKALPKHLSA